MPKNKKAKGTSNKFSQWSKEPWLLLLLLLVFIPPLVMIGWIWLSDWLYQITGFNTSPAGLNNQDWVMFWGAYFGGIATVIAVRWTVFQTERHYLQTSEEQKRQNSRLAEEREHQRRLDVLPIVLLQARVVRQSSNLALLLGEPEDEIEVKSINVDEIKPIYEEYDVSEITVLFAPESEMRLGEPSKEEMHRVRNNGHEIVPLGNGKKADYLKTITFLRPFWCINAGKEAAININIYLITPNNQEPKYLPHVLSLMPKEKIKLYFLVDMPGGEVASLYGKYQFGVRYSDIYATKYSQKYEIDISAGDNGDTVWSMMLGVEQHQEV
jgi:hypothetical protein